MKHTWKIEAQNAGQRLDVFLAERLQGKTRSAVAKMIRQGAAQVNGKEATVHRFLKAGDEVAFDDAPIRQSGSVPVRPTSDPLPPTHLSIIEETPDWLVINKPAGVLVHSSHTNHAPSLVDALIAHCPPIAKVGEDPDRPGIVHRLDKEVGGLMVIAKTQTAFDHLKRQFATHSVDKSYLALVHGELPKDEGDIKFRIARSSTKARMAARPEHEEEGRAAWTHYKVLKRFRYVTLCRVTILSGRTHQIRAHMHGLGHPVIGDPLYTLRQPNRRIGKSPLLLQSISLAFDDPKTGERRSFVLPPDPALEKHWLQLKAK